jgi:hypothetical protein
MQDALSSQISVGPCVWNQTRKCKDFAACAARSAYSRRAARRAIRSGTRYAKWAGGSRSQTHRRAAMGVSCTQGDTEAQESAVRPARSRLQARCTAQGAIRSGTRYAKWAGGSHSQTHRRAAMGGFTQDDGYVQGVAVDALRLFGSSSTSSRLFGQNPILPYN